MANPWDSDPVVSSGNPWDKDEVVSGKPIATLSAPEITVRPNPTSDMSTYDKVAAGAGKAIYDTGRGVYQLGADIGNKVGLVSDNTIAKLKQEADQTRALDQPLMDTGAGTAGYIGGNVAAMALPFGLAGAAAKTAGMARAGGVLNALANPTTYAAAAASGALQGSVQPVGEQDSRAFNTGVGAALGGLGNGIVNGAGRLVQPVKNALSDAGQKAVQVLTDNGVPLDAAQRSGSALLSRFRSSLSDNPFTLGAQKDLQGQQKQAYNKAVLNTIGSDSSAATSDAMSKAASDINATFSDVLSRNNLKANDGFLSNLSDLQARATEEEKKPIASIINRITDAIDDKGEIPGQTAYNIKKDLDRMASSQDTTQNYYARKVRSQLMNTLNDSLSGEDQAAFQAARGQFRNMKQIEGAVSEDGKGDISPARLANVLGQKKNLQQSLYGKGDQTLVDLAQSGKQLLPDKLNNSGTVARIAMQAALPLLAGGANGLYSGDWMGAAKTAATVAAIPKIGQFALNNPAISNYLVNGIGGKEGSGAAANFLRSLMLAPQNNALAGATIKRVPNALYNKSQQ